MDTGWTGAIVGIAGGIFGTCCGIKNTNGARERAFMIKASGVCWVCVLNPRVTVRLFLFAIPKRWCV